MSRNGFHGRCAQGPVAEHNSARGGGAEADMDARPVLVPGSNKDKLDSAAARKPSPKLLRKANTAVGMSEKPAASTAAKEEGAKKNVAPDGGTASGQRWQRRAVEESSRRGTKGNSAARLI
ncbi:hypothetical protein GUJ93_ZPchr0004g38140 [Zizania palustris]|uniref:Uncharacterized protein n=1 Tax=Zizania palustris TaxID=103762 RepID=A0A8J5VYI9_ZIZPA|nr:hypothetical protein GUJ93_ZPchr0004g38140 [Zizania palustris]